METMIVDNGHVTVMLTMQARDNALVSSTTRARSLSLGNIIMSTVRTVYGDLCAAFDTMSSRFPGEKDRDQFL